MKTLLKIPALIIVVTAIVSGFFLCMLVHFMSIVK